MNQTLKMSTQQYKNKNYPLSADSNFSVNEMSHGNLKSLGSRRLSAFFNRNAFWLIYLNEKSG